MDHPDGVRIRAGRYLLIFASGLEEDELANGNARVLHASFKLSAEGENLALVKPDGTTIAYQLDFTDVPQVFDTSYGLPPDASGFRTDVSGKPGYLASPTPMQANDIVLDGLVAPVTINQPHGFYDAPIQVQLSTSTEGAAIRYTTDGSEPSARNGRVFDGDSLTIDRTTTLRVRATKENWKTVSRANIDLPVPR